MRRPGRARVPRVRYGDAGWLSLLRSMRHGPITEAILALSADSREAVDELADKALAAGGSEANEPMEYGLMYGQSFPDPEGHLWEVAWMDPPRSRSARRRWRRVSARCSYGVPNREHSSSPYSWAMF